MIYEDVQNQNDIRGLAINQVGISDLRYPIRVLDRENSFQSTVARIAVSVDLPHHFRGTHMSRFVEVLNQHHQELTIRTIPTNLWRPKATAGSRVRKSDRGPPLLHAPKNAGERRGPVARLPMQIRWAF